MKSFEKTFLVPKKGESFILGGAQKQKGLLLQNADILCLGVLAPRQGWRGEVEDSVAACSCKFGEQGGQPAASQPLYGQTDGGWGAS